VACCAFALFVIGQIAALFVAMRRALGFSVPEGDAPPVNPATTWQLNPAPSGGHLPPPPPRRRRLGAWLVTIALLEIGLVATGATWVRGHHQPASASASASLGETAWCGSTPLPVDVVRLRD
jgi:hypothetical protein